jgi:PAS domain S-box-containing protein
LPGSPCLALCQYDRRRFEPDILLEVLHTHPIVVNGTDVYENSYYLPPEKLRVRDPSAALLDHWLHHLEEQDRTAKALAHEAEINKLMADLSSALIMPVSLEDISYLILERAKGFTGSQYGYVGYIDPQSGNLVSTTMTRDIWDTCQVADKRVVFETFSGLCGWVLENRKPLLTNAPADDPRSSGVPEGHLPIRRFLSAPALVHGELMGQIALANADRDYTERDVVVVERLASLYGLAIQRHRAQESLQDANERISSLLDSISDGFMALDNDLVITYFSKAAERILGRPGEEVIGHPLFESFPEAKGSIFEEKYMRAIREKETIFFETYFGVAPYENWYDVRVYPYRDGISVFFQVITERKRAEQALKESEEKYRTLVEQSLQGVVIAQADPVRLSFANQSMEAICGFSPQELLHMGPAELAGLIHPKDREVFFQNFQDRLAGEDVEPRREYRILHRNGRVHWALSYSSLIEYGGSPATLTVFVDITDRKKAQQMLARQAAELARSNQELQEFAYIASHDLQEPLRMVSSYVQLLAQRYQGRLDTEADEFIAYAVEGATRLQTLIRDLLHYSRVDQVGKDFEPTDCEFILESALDNLQVAIQETEAVVTYGPMPTVLADPTQLGQVFQNLIGNAIKFCDGKPPKVHISAELKDADWIFAIRDNGIGIEAEYLAKIFEAFQRLHHRDTYPGSGIGLALCKKIVERHGGNIWAESQPGSGSTFYYTIPSERDENP